ADYVANATKSSQATGYPASNALNVDKRRRVWRSSGYWLVEEGSNKIVFRETAGVDLEAEVAAGEYTSDTTFLAAIKTALEAAGDSTYTVERDSTTGRIKITSNGVGGDGILQLMWSDADSAGMAALLGFSTSGDDTGALSY